MIRYNYSIFNLTNEVPISQVESTQSRFIIHRVSAIILIEFNSQLLTSWKTNFCI